MFSSLIDDRTHMSVCQRIENGFSFSPAFHQLILLQNSKLVGNRRLRHIQCFCQITDTHFCFKQQIEDPDTGGMTKNFKQLRQILEFLFPGKFFVNDVKQIFMKFFCFTAFDLVLILVHFIILLLKILYIKCPNRI